MHGEAPAANALKEQIEEQFGEAVYVPFQGDTATIKGRTCEIQTSNIPAVSVEMEMEDFLRTVDSVYRLQRRKILQTVIKNPELMEPIIKTVQKGWNYMKKLFSSYNI
jgi:metallo-beta-lactamase family protein